MEQDLVWACGMVRASKQHRKALMTPFLTASCNFSLIFSSQVLLDLIAVQEKVHVLNWKVQVTLFNIVWYHCFAFLIYQCSFQGLLVPGAAEITTVARMLVSNTIATLFSFSS